MVLRGGYWWVDAPWEEFHWLFTDFVFSSASIWGPSVLWLRSAFRLILPSLSSANWPGKPWSNHRGHTSGKRRSWTSSMAHGALPLSSRINSQQCRANNRTHCRHPGRKTKPQTTAKIVHQRRRACCPICHGSAELETDDSIAIFLWWNTRVIFCWWLSDDNHHRNALMKWQFRQLAKCFHPSELSTWTGKSSPMRLWWSWRERMPCCRPPCW